MASRVLIAGTHSGSGKTTLTLALLSALKKQGVHLSSFKCGPDYIDPKFHREVIGIPGRNLDPFFLSSSQLRATLSEAHGDLSIIEGVMGYYDGVGIEGRHSTHEVAHTTNTPVILVISAKGMYTSAGAVLQGFLTYRKEHQIQGVIFNNTSETVYTGLKQIAQDLGVRPLGYLPYKEECRIGSRHLGLLPSSEVEHLKEKLSLLGDLAAQTIDLEGVMELAKAAPPLVEKSSTLSFVGHSRIAVASDEAFCFLYPENLELLRQTGAEIIYFSPLRDEELPEDIDALYLPGGYPELYLAPLSQNRSMLSSIKKHIGEGLITLAEGGGFAYLHASFEGKDLVGAIPGHVQMGKRLQHFGYHTLRALRDNLLCKKGESFPVHEYHYYVSDCLGSDFIACKLDGRSWETAHAGPSLFASFAGLYFPARTELAAAFSQAACRRREERKHRP